MRVPREMSDEEIIRLFLKEDEPQAFAALDALTARIEELERERDGELTLRDEARNDPWSFRRGTLRERLEWARVQHLVSADAVPPERTTEERRRFHLACVEWYEGVLKTLGEIEQRMEGLGVSLREEWFSRLLPILDYEEKTTGRWAWLDHPWFALLGLTEVECIAALAQSKDAG